jgi:hypothetical protein
MLEDILILPLDIAGLKSAAVAVPVIVQYTVPVGKSVVTTLNVTELPSLTLDTDGVTTAVKAPGAVPDFTIDPAFPTTTNCDPDQAELVNAAVVPDLGLLVQVIPSGLVLIALADVEKAVKSGEELSELILSRTPDTLVVQVIASGLVKTLPNEPPAINCEPVQVIPLKGTL